MQDRYAGDIGDYIKLAFLRFLSPGYRLGVAWYLYPDEGHNFDGRHIAYLDNPAQWRHLDAALFDRLRLMLEGGRRSVSALEKLGSLDAVYHRAAPVSAALGLGTRDKFRANWFRDVQQTLRFCSLIFADPDNGLVDNDAKRRRSKEFGKHIPLHEVRELAEGRTVIVYHHNSRFRGGHDREVEHWLSQLGAGAMAVRANAYSCRTFFIVNPTDEIKTRAIDFCMRWSAHRVRNHERHQVNILDT